MVIPEYDDLLARLLATRAVQERLAAAWTWEEKTLAQWDEHKPRLEAAKAELDGAEATEALRIGALQKAGAALHDATRQALGLAKVRFRNAPETLRAFAGLQARKTSLPAIRQSADDLAAAWEKADAEGAYAGQTLAGYNALRADLAGHERARSDARAATKQAKQTFAEERRRLHQDLVAWYAAAGRVFPADTAEGRLLRAEIPTT